MYVQSVLILDVMDPFENIIISDFILPLHHILFEVSFILNLIP